MFLKIGIFKNVANFAGKHLCWSFFFFNRTPWVAASENNEQQ